MNNMWILTSDLVINISEDDVIKLDGKSITVSFRPKIGFKTKDKKVLTISFASESKAKEGWEKVMEGFSKNHRYLILESEFTTMKDRQVAKRRGFLRR